MVRWAFVFMILSGLGPIALGPLAVMGYKHTMWYQFSIYFYLHFQYNGWFTLAIFGLVLRVLDQSEVRRTTLDSYGIYLTVLGVVLGYFHNTIGHAPSALVIALSTVGYGMQVIAAGILLLPRLKPIRAFLKRKRSLISDLLLWLVIILFVLKYLVPLISTTVSLQILAFRSRNLIIAYLHMVLLGFVSGYVIWNFAVQYADRWAFKIGVFLYLLSFVLSELLLVLIGFGLLGTLVLYFNLAMFVFAILLLFSVILLYGLHIWGVGEWR